MVKIVVRKISNIQTRPKSVHPCLSETGMKHDKDGIRVVQKGAGNNRRIRAAAKKCECDEAMKQRTTDASFVAASTCEQ